MTKLSNKEYVIHFTQSKQVTGVPEGQIKRELRRLLTEARFAQGYYSLKIRVASPEMLNPGNQPKLIVSVGPYVNTMKIEFRLASGTYQGILTHPDRAISGDRIKLLGDAAKRLPTLAQRSEDEVPRSIRRTPNHTMIGVGLGSLGMEAGINPSESNVRADASLLSERLNTLTAKIVVLQGQLALPRSALHPSAKEPIRREITFLQGQISDLEKYNQINH